MATETRITARGNLHGLELIDAEAINPGGWFGKAWLLEVGGSYSSLFLVVEADNVSDAVDELSDSRFGHLIHVADEDIGDYPEDDRHYDGSGRVLDLDHLMIHGSEGAELPFPCTYHGTYEGRALPESGVSPTLFDAWTRQGEGTGINWDAVRAELDSAEWEDRGDGMQERLAYLGTVFSLMPSGKYYTAWANSNVSEAEAEQDEAFRELLESEAEAHGLFIAGGEGDPCDVFAGECRDTPESSD